MPHVSKKKISEKIFRTILRGLVFNVRKAAETKDALALVYGLLTKTERIMLAKRLAAIQLISRGVPLRRVSVLLGLSLSTVQRFSASVEYEKVVRLLAFLQKKRPRFWKEVEFLLRAGLPPRRRGRWQRIYEHLDA